jgi:hypothetical protein
MNGHVFECYDESGDRTQFSKTLEALKEYAAKHCDRPNDLKPMFEENMTLPKIPEPGDLPEDAKKKEEFLWQTAMKSYSARKEDLDSNLNSLYSVIWGQCSENMKTKIRSINEYTEKTKQDDCVWLLSQIKSVVHQFDTKKDLWTSLRHARIAYANCKQEPNQSNSDYLEVFRTIVEVLEYYNADISESVDLLTEPEYKTMSTAEKKKAAYDRTLATAFLDNADPIRYGSLLSHLSNQYTLGTNQYPRDLTAAYGLLVNYQPPPTPAARPTPTTHTPVPSTVANSTSPNTNSTTVSAPYSAIPSTTDSPFSLVGLSLVQSSTPLSYKVPEEWILLDS